MFQKSVIALAAAAIIGIAALAPTDASARGRGGGGGGHSFHGGGGHAFRGGGGRSFDTGGCRRPTARSTCRSISATELRRGSRSDPSQQSPGFAMRSRDFLFWPDPQITREGRLNLLAGQYH